MFVNVGDIEKQDEETVFIRIYYSNSELEILNKLLGSHLSITEWITIVVKPNGIEKIVAYSEADNYEYDITYLYSENSKLLILSYALLQQ